MDEYFLNEKENLIRKIWLVFLLTSFASELVGTFLCLIGVWPLPVWNPAIPLTPKLKIIIYSSAFSGIFSINFLYYWFAYKKHGTRLLTFSLWMFWFGLISEVLRRNIFPGFNQDLPPFIPETFGGWVERISCWGFGITSYVLSYKLRAINRSLKQRKASALDSYPV